MVDVLGPSYFVIKSISFKSSNDYTLSTKSVDTKLFSICFKQEDSVSNKATYQKRIKHSKWSMNDTFTFRIESMPSIHFRSEILFPLHTDINSNQKLKFMHRLIKLLSLYLHQNFLQSFYF